MNLFEALKETGKAEHETGKVICVPDHRIDVRKLEVKWELFLDEKWEPSPRSGFFEKIAKQGIPGKTIITSKKGKAQEVYCGFTSNGKMMTDEIGFSTRMVHYDNEDLHCWEIEQ